MATFRELREAVMKRAKVRNRFSFRKISPAHDDFWNKMNAVEYDRGYKPGENEKPDTPALCDMNLLTKVEFNKWLKDFEAIQK